MSNATEAPSAVSEPRRLGRFADFFIRLLKEKALGTFGGMIVLLLILVAIFADALAPYPFDEMHLRDRMTGSSCPVSSGEGSLLARSEKGEMTQDKNKENTNRLIYDFVEGNAPRLQLPEVRLCFVTTCDRPQICRILSRWPLRSRYVEATSVS